MATKILIRRGLYSTMPVLSQNELGFATDQKKLYIGTADGNHLVTSNIAATDVFISDPGGDFDNMSVLEVLLLLESDKADKSDLDADKIGYSDPGKPYDNWTVKEIIDDLSDVKADKIEVRQVGEEVITYTNGKVTMVDSDTVTTTISYDIDGNFDEIIEFYKLDSKTYKTTLTKDVDGKITKVTKGEI